MRPCPSFPGYSVDEFGQVFTHRARFGLGKGRGGGVRNDPTFVKRLEVWPGHGGYPYVSVATSRGQRSLPVHRLVADAFHGPQPDGLEVRHLDGNPLNSAPDNLKYGTEAENAADRLRCGVRMEGESHPRAKLNAHQVATIRKLAADGHTIKGLARTYGVGATTVRDIVRGRRWRAETGDSTAMRPGIETPEGES
jgi:hypothetical protein